MFLKARVYIHIYIYIYESYMFIYIEATRYEGTKVRRYLRTKIKVTRRYEGTK